MAKIFLPVLTPLLLKKKKEREKERKGWAVATASASPLSPFPSLFSFWPGVARHCSGDISATGVVASTG